MAIRPYPLLGGAIVDWWIPRCAKTPHAPDVGAHRHAPFFSRPPHFEPIPNYGWCQSLGGGIHHLMPLGIGLAPISPEHLHSTVERSTIRAGFIFGGLE